MGRSLGLWVDGVSEPHRVGSCLATSLVPVVLLPSLRLQGSWRAGLTHRGEAAAMETPRWLLMAAGLTASGGTLFPT